MSFLEAVRDRLRDEYEERMETTIRILDFQLQLKTSNYTAKELIHQVDPSAPIPQAVEGGDMNGPLYQCLLREEKQDALLTLCEAQSQHVKLYSKSVVFDLEKSLYRPDWYVHWQLGTPPTVKAMP
jgi:hypothetical protein